MMIVAPLDYERYATLYGLVAVPVEGSPRAKPPPRLTEEAGPVSVEVGRRQTYSIQGEAGKFSLAPVGNPGSKLKPVTGMVQNLTDISSLAEIIHDYGTSGAGSNRPSAGKVSDLYGTPERNARTNLPATSMIQSA